MEAVPKRSEAENHALTFRSSVKRWMAGDAEKEREINHSRWSRIGIFLVCLLRLPLTLTLCRFRFIVLSSFQDFRYSPQMAALPSVRISTFFGVTVIRN